MADKGPKTERGKIRKAETGDGRRRTFGEELEHGLLETEETIRRGMREVNKATRTPSGKSRKKKTTKRK